jgi:hypothetical protein
MIDGRAHVNLALAVAATGALQGEPLIATSSSS